MGYVAFLLWQMEVFEVDNCKAFYSFKEETREIACVTVSPRSNKLGSNTETKNFLI